LNFLLFERAGFYLDFTDFLHAIARSSPLYVYGCTMFKPAAMERRTMKTARALVLILTLGGATLLLSGISNDLADTLKGPTNPHTLAAFRDGLYQARLQAQRGDRPHLATGRWQQARDQELFVSGFRHGYAQFYAAHPELKRRIEAPKVQSVRYGQQMAVEQSASESSKTPEI
jgi:hypothetical protein